MVRADTTPLHGPGSEPVTDTDFAARLVAIRKNRGMTQQAVADRSGAHVTQIRRYEGGSSQPTLDVLRNLALALDTSADSLLFDVDERGPSTPDSQLLLGALDHLDPGEQAAVVTLLEGVLMRHQLRQVPAMGQPTAS